MRIYKLYQKTISHMDQNMTRIRILLFFTSMLITSTLESQHRQVTIMLDPAGHAKNPGRKLINGFERAETLKLTESLERYLKTVTNLKWSLHARLAKKSSLTKRLVCQSFGCRFFPEFTYL